MFYLTTKGAKVHEGNTKRADQVVQALLTAIAFGRTSSAGCVAPEDLTHFPASHPALTRWADEFRCSAAGSEASWAARVFPFGSPALTVSSVTRCLRSDSASLRRQTRQGCGGTVSLASSERALSLPRSSTAETEYQYVLPLAALVSRKAGVFTKSVLIFIGWDDASRRYTL